MELKVFLYHLHDSLKRSYVTQNSAYMRVVSLIFTLSFEYFFDDFNTLIMCYNKEGINLPYPNSEPLSILSTVHLRINLDRKKVEHRWKQHKKRKLINVSLS